jgi:ATP-dependent Clp endopeptidase proteolytic subunit ClpP
VPSHSDELAPIVGTIETDLDRSKKEAEIERLRLQAEELRLDIEHSRLGLADRQRIAADDAATSERNRRFSFYGSVSDVTVAMAMYEIGKWARKEHGPIEIMFNSPGGSITDGLALYDYLRFLSGRGNTITTVGLGMVASMGAVLLQAGDRRIVGRNTHLLIHEPSSGAIGKVSDIRDKEKFVAGLWDKLVAILAERSNLTGDEIRERSDRRDWWFDAETAVELGFADEIQ